MAEAREQIYAVLVALEGDTLLMPNAAVAEVVSADGLQPAIGGAEWLVGSYLWNGRRVSIVSFEALNGGERPQPTRRSRLVILNPFDAQAGAGQLGFLAQGYPHLITLNRAALVPAPMNPNDRERAVVMRVRIANTSVAIPDLESLEQELGAAQAAAAA